MDEWIDGAWIRRRLLETGKTQRDIARALGIDASGVSRLLDGRRKLQAQEARKINAFFETGPDAESATVDDGSKPADAEWRQRRQNAPGPKPHTRFASDIPIYGSLLPDKPPFMHLSAGMPVEYRTCPPQCVGVPDAFGLFIPDDSLAPRMRTGEVVYVHPSLPAVVGADVFVRLRSPAGRVAIVRYVGGAEDSLSFIAVNGREPSRRTDEVLVLRRDEIDRIGRILLISMT